jgi:hypothetical protein
MTRFGSALIIVLTVASLAAAQNIGPDIIVGDLPDLDNYAPAGGYHAYSVGTTSCNTGTQNANWIASTNDHPVIGQQLYRIRDGVFQQVGNSWLKHGFLALTESLCGPCNGQGGSVLGVGCSDPYDAFLNGLQQTLGPRGEVNAATGIYPYPHGGASITDTTSARLRVPSSLVMNQPQGTRFLIEGHYVTKDDATAGNGWNNASWREVTASSGGSLTLTGATVREQPAIMGWQAIEPQVQVVYQDVIGDGRFYLAFNAFPTSGGFRRYVYALHNLNSDLGAGRFEVQMPAGATVQNLTFHDADYHSGEVWQSTDWTGNYAGGLVTWQTPTPFGVNPNGPALRWGSTHTFTFESDMVPLGQTVGLFKVPTTLTFAPFVPPTPQWQTNQPQASLDINGIGNNTFEGPVRVILGFGVPATVNFSSGGSAGAVFDIFSHAGDGVSRNAGGFALSDGQIVNLDLSNPTLTSIFGGFQPVSGSQSLPFVTPTSPVDLVTQLGVVDVATASGWSLSAAVELDVEACNAGSVTHGLGDDSFVAVPLGPGTGHSCVTGVSFYGTTYSTVFINSNGSVSMTGGSTEFQSSPSAFLSQMPRIAAQWTDLDPSSGGTITSTSTASGELTVSFRNVPEYGSFSTASFDIVFRTNGDVEIANRAIVGAWGTSTLVGFTPSGTAPGSFVSFSSLVGSPTTYPAGNAVYQFQLNGSPSGFTSITRSPTGLVTVN